MHSLCASEHTGSINNEVTYDGLADHYGAWRHLTVTVFSAAIFLPTSHLWLRQLQLQLCSHALTQASERLSYSDRCIGTVRGALH